MSAFPSICQILRSKLISCLLHGTESYKQSSHVLLLILIAQGIPWSLGKVPRECLVSSPRHRLTPAFYISINIFYLKQSRRSNVHNDPCSFVQLQLLKAGRISWFWRTVSAWTNKRLKSWNESPVGFDGASKQVFFLFLKAQQKILFAESEHGRSIWQVILRIELWAESVSLLYPHKNGGGGNIADLYIIQL